MLMWNTGSISIGLFVFGAIIGSFLHVIAERYSLSKGVFHGRSHCDSCKRTLSALQLVPLLSYTLGRARCTFCGAEIPYHYPVMELCSGIITVALLAPSIIQQGLPSFQSVLLFIAACILLVLTRIDVKHMVLPDGFVFSLAIVGMWYALVRGDSLDGIAIAVTIGAVTLYLLWAVTLGRGIGFGDVKLMIPLGILLGIQGIITLLFFSFFLGGAFGIFLLLTKKATAKTAIPFGPFLAGTALYIMAFPQIADRFLSFLGV